MDYKVGDLLAYGSVLGLVGLAVFDFMGKNYPGSWQSLMAALAVLGLKMSGEGK
jgi:hypothetical protein